jgi:hypothetical protein
MVGIAVARLSSWGDERNFAIVPSARTGESALLNASSERCSIFLWGHSSSPVFTTPLGECNAITNRSHGESELIFLPCNDCGNQHSGGMVCPDCGMLFLADKTRQVNLSGLDCVQHLHSAVLATVEEINDQSYPEPDKQACPTFPA